MGGYVTAPASWRKTPDALDGWVAKSLAHVAALPPKAPKATKGTKAPKKG
jgi:hypothetical protein